jgi:hypothetical protein
MPGESLDFDRPDLGHCAEAPTPGEDGQVAGGRVAPEAARPSH